MNQKTVWTFADLGFFLGAILPSWLLASLVTGWIVDNTARGLVRQVTFYALLLSVLVVLARIRHDCTLGVAVNWNPRFRGAWKYLALSPVLALGANLLAAYWRAPMVPSAIDVLSASPIPLPVVSLFAVVVGPLFEEVAFRGFLQPLFQNRWGNRTGMFVTAVGFSLLHGAQYEWAWQFLLMLLLVGMALGLARHRTGSTAASFLMHMGYNLTQFAAAMILR